MSHGNLKSEAGIMGLERWISSKEYLLLSCKDLNSDPNTHMNYSQL